MGMEYCPLPVEDTLNLPGMLPTELAMACDTKPMAVAMRKKSARRLIIPRIPSSYLIRPTTCHAYRGFNQAIVTAREMSSTKIKKLNFRKKL
jgi:hypothetical protein